MTAIPTDDEVSLSAVVLGGVASARTRGAWFFEGSLAVGVFLGRIRDRREGRFVDNTGAGVVVGPLQQDAAAFGAWISPSVAVARQLGPRFAVGIDVATWLLVPASTPRWSVDTPATPAGALGLSRFGEESLAGRATLFLAPSLFGRAAF